LGGLTSWAKISLLLTVIAVIGLTVVDTIGNHTVPGFVTGNFEPEGNAIILVIGLLLFGLAVLACMLSNIIAICMWMYRANTNIRALGTQGVTYTPGWCAGYWFVPFLNLVRPYQAMKEIYQASASSDTVASQSKSWQFATVPGVFSIWWFCWIVGNIASRAESKLVQAGVQDLTITTSVSMLAMILTVAGALTCIKVLTLIHQAQAQAQRITSS